MQTLTITTSWDDGHPADLALAEMLARHGACGTFYICRDYGGRPRLSDSEIVELAGIPGIEIGSHTLTHPDLRRISNLQLWHEVEGSRKWLQDLLGHDIAGFCYPKGLNNKRSVSAVLRAGYTHARTTRGGSTTMRFPPLRMPTTLQFYPHRRSTQLRHALHEIDCRGFKRIALLDGWSRRPSELATKFATTEEGHETVLLHIWGHSWELTPFDLWNDLRKFLVELERARPLYLTNSGVMALGRASC